MSRQTYAQKQLQQISAAVNFKWSPLDGRHKQFARPSTNSVFAHLADLVFAELIRVFTHNSVVDVVVERRAKLEHTRQ